ncbi:hypothetical protein F3J24_23755 [Comamonas sp. Tr-654]|nr:hypothetical protein [Comamonas sp. Tr-654]
MYHPLCGFAASPFKGDDILAAGRPLLDVSVLGRVWFEIAGLLQSEKRRKSVCSAWHERIHFAACHCSKPPPPYLF